MSNLITATELRALAGNSKQVSLPKGSILTPSAYDAAKEENITLLWVARGNEIVSAQKLAPSTTSVPTLAGPVDGCTQKLMTQAEVVEVVRTVVGRMMKPACANPRVTHVKASDVVMEPFDQAPPGQKILLKDVVTSRDANLGAGFMSFDHSSLPWHLTYDEVDYVVEGTFTLQAGGKTYTCNAGDVMYIPKDTQVVFGSPSQAKVFYVTYPANWSEL